MRAFRHAHCLFLFVMLADVAPGPLSCSDSRYKSRPSLEVTAPDCSCSSGTIEVYVDGQLSGTTSCGSVLSIKVASGPHSVRATTAARTWPSQTYVVPTYGRQSVDLACVAE
jgi:hypothetical protein